MFLQPTLCSGYSSTVTKASFIVKCVLWTRDPEIITVLCNKLQYFKEILATSYHNWMYNSV